MTNLPPRRRTRDAELMRALAHPLRASLLSYLSAVGPRTASECARAVDSTASNCSWHLRQLAQYGLVEPSEGADGRQRPWRVGQVGLDIGAFDDDPAVRVAQLAVASTAAREEQELTTRFLDTARELDPEWQRASAFNTYTLRVTPAELDALVAAVDALIRPYVSTIRTDAPADARPVHAGLRAFPRIEADGRPSS
ncbi:ArsR/SmtB family transcription factor [Amycolatopsis cihanbeyliensis]|uniref:ArsR family transcriptional regulator n=1 Tax=Amycolatopsis cihanbeyliensis TaxID=1128664 RepID=A0A542DCG0_AMYCI|nr:helix-turn-helix domain-containing protein [Amycolatopsis cihanbeyliensis]TQJ00760.1 ArsR family transcriptional regulator [Amycolatopsis cihanbeyliensis]